ncbi:MAG: hypothetical protein ACI80V_000057 [Rhodothermales bacterium]
MALVLLAVAPAPSADAQVVPVYSIAFRPPGVNYLVMRSRHFDVIYQDGTEDQARELAAVLESTLPAVGEIFPVRSNFHLSVVLNRYGDRGNGFVATVPFKSEIEGIELFGRGLSNRHSNWLMAVGPHELVHAAQGDYSAGFGVHSLLRPFAPDIARALNLWVPPGIAEGAAVSLESSLEKRAGRLNHPWFTMQYRAAVGAGKPWSLAQMLERPWYTRPTDRFYKGGAALMEALTDSDGHIPALRRATAFHNRFPLLGYGVSFWYGTGEFPASFGRKLRKKAIQDEAARVEALGTLTSARLVSGRKGQVIRRPRWVDDQSVIGYMTSYNRRRGLHAIDMATGAMRLVTFQDLTEELQFSLSPDGQSILLSRYVRKPLSGQTDADVFRVDRSTGDAERLTTEAGLLSPVELPDGRIWAIRLDGAFTTWVESSGGGEFSPVLPPARDHYKQLELSPDYGSVAIIRNVLGSQGLYVSSVSEPRLEPAVVFENASVYDATWSPDGRWVVFTADPTDALNVFAYSISDGSVRQLTNARYGALEGTVSPDGQELAFIEFQDQRLDLKVMPFAPETAPRVQGTGATPPQPGAFIDTTGVARLAGAYKSLPNLRPRLLYPTAYYETTTSVRPGADLGAGIGLAMQGTDPLARWAYWGEGFYQGERMWGEAGITTAATVVRPALRLYRRPDQFLARVGSGSTADTLRVISDERGAEFSVSLPVTLSNNIHNSTANFGLFFNARENRLLGAGNEVVREWTNSATITPVARFSLGMQNALRDLIFSRGITFTSATEFEFYPERFGGAGTASYNELGIFLPFLSRLNTGLKLELASLSQTQAFVFNTDFFMPRGHEDIVPGRGTVVRAGLEVLQPILYPDNGFLIIPSFLRAVYAFGFAERLSPTEDFDRHLTSVGGGIGLQFNLLHVFEFDLRFGKAYRTGDTPYTGWTTVYR